MSLSPAGDAARNKLRKRQALLDRAFRTVCAICTWAGILILFVLIGKILYEGLPNLSWDFLSNFPSRKAEKAGLKAAIAGTAWVISLTALVSIPVGISAAIYLEEYGTKNKLSTFLETNISNLAGVPSIVYGILGLAILVRMFQLGVSVLAGALTLSLLILPIIIVSSREALRAVPPGLRQASYALGASKWYTVSRIVLPSALPGILTGVILSLSRAIGETAPLIIVGAASYIAYTPTGPMDQYTVLPMQIFEWAGRPQDDFRDLAASGIIVLLVALFTMNALAIWLRQHYSTRLRGK